MMTITLWIHRACASDIVVRFCSNITAYLYAVEMLEKYDDAVIADWDFNSFNDHGECFHVGQTSDLQLSLHVGDFDPTKDDIVWNPIGTVLATAQEATALGELNEPEGFVPNESESLWQKEKRTHAELDEELTTYRMECWV